MRLVIHDLKEEQFEAIISDKIDKNDMVVDSNQPNHYCIGCFGCWLKTPGECVIKDEYQMMGRKLSKADELVIISKATFGSFSSSVKNVLDRSISYVLPYFEIRNGEMHHGERYHKNLKVSACFYGSDITEAEKETSRNLVKANAVNLNGEIRKVCFVNELEKIKEVF